MSTTGPQGTAQYQYESGTGRLLWVTLPNGVYTTGTANVCGSVRVIPHGVLVLWLPGESAPHLLLHSPSRRRNV